MNQLNCDNFHCQKFFTPNTEEDWEITTEMRIRRGTKSHGVYMGLNFCSESCFIESLVRYFGIEKFIEVIEKMKMNPLDHDILCSIDIGSLLFIPS